MVRTGDLGDFVVGKLHLREKFWRSDVWNEEHALGADDDRTLVGFGLALGFAGSAGVVDGGHRRGVFGRDERADFRGWALVAVVPSDRDGFICRVRCARENVADDGVSRPVPAVGGGTIGAHGQWRGEGDGFEDGIEDVATHVAEGARAEVEAFAPIAGMIITRNIRTFGGVTKPEVPVETLRYRCAGDGRDPDVAPLFITPGVDFFHFADGAAVNDCDSLAVNFLRVNLDAHLCSELFLAGEFGKHARLVDVVREGFLAVNVFAELHRGVGDGRVHVVGHGDVARVDVALLFVEELAPVLVDAHVGEHGFDVGDFVEIDVGDGDEFHERIAGDGLDVGPRHAGGAEAGVAENLARLRGEQTAREKRRGEAGGTEGFKKGAAWEGFHTGGGGCQCVKRAGGAVIRRVR